MALENRKSIKKAIQETNRRRQIQIKYNTKNKIHPGGRSTQGKPGTKPRRKNKH